MPSSCAVACCKSPKGITYFSLPKEGWRRQSWIDACHRKGQLPKIIRICELHFAEACFKRDMMAELRNEKPRRLLHDDAVPTLNLLPPDSVVSSAKKKPCPASQNREERAVKKARSELIKELLTEGIGESPILVPYKRKIPPPKVKKPSAPPIKPEPDPFASVFTQTVATSTANKYCQVDNTNCGVKLLKRANGAIAKLQRENEALKKNNQRLIAKNRALNGKICSLNSQSHKKRIVSDHLRNVHHITEPQIEKMVYGKKNVKWTMDDYVNGLLLRSLTMQSYEHVRKMSPVPLPSLPTLKNYVKRNY